MRVAIPTEVAPGERRVAATPETAGKMVKAGFEVVIQSGAGAESGFEDEAYRQAGAVVEPEVDKVWAGANVVLKVQSPRKPEGSGPSEVERLSPGALLVSFLQPMGSPDLVRKLADGKVEYLALEYLPRITRAQAMDALTSMASIAGYKAVLLGAAASGKFFPLMMTPAGTIAPSRVLVLGAGVAGLAAVGTAKRLGAVVEASDIRPAAREQVESLGATFIDLGMKKEEAETAGGYAKEISKDQHAREQEIIHERIRKADVVITTALIPGRKAPVLVTEDMVKSMARGSVVVDLAAEQGGNCTLTEAGKTAVKHGVTLLGPINLPSTLATDASRMYSRNVLALLLLVVKDGKIQLDLADEIVKGALVVHEGRIAHEGLRKEHGGDPG